MSEEHEDISDEDISDEEWIIWQQAMILYRDKEIERLRAAFVELSGYVNHEAGCYRRYEDSEHTRAHWLGPKECTCGLDQALKGGAA